MSNPVARKSSGEEKPHYRRQDNASLLIQTESQNETHRYREEREQEEYYYVHSRPQSEASESATINFLTDDRLEQHEHEYQEEHRNQSYKVLNLLFF